MSRVAVRVVVVMAVLMTAGGVGAAWALFASPTTASFSVTTRTLVAPTSLTAAASGHDVALSWSAANGNGYSLLGAANGNSNNCSAATFSALSSTTSLTATDTGRHTPQGSFYCYEVKTTDGPWTSAQTSPRAAAQLGFVISSIVQTNAANVSACGGTSSGVAGVLDCGDQFVVTFSQAVNPQTGPPAADNVCSDQTVKAVYLASTGTGSCASSEQFDVAKLTGGSGGTRKSRYAATFTWSNNNTVLTILVGRRSSGTADGSVATGLTVNPTTNAAMLHSSTGAFNICTTNANTGDNCLATTTAGTSW